MLNIYGTPQKARVSGKLDDLVDNQQVAAALAQVQQHQPAVPEDKKKEGDDEA
jgi:hypothetical protein